MQFYIGPKWGVGGRGVGVESSPRPPTPPQAPFLRTHPFPMIPQRREEAIISGPCSLSALLIYFKLILH